MNPLSANINVRGDPVTITGVLRQGDWQDQVMPSAVLSTVYRAVKHYA